MRGRAYEKSLEAVALVDDVDVVRYRLARRDGSVLGGGGVRGHTGREPGRVEPEVIAVTHPYERSDVTEDPVAARLGSDRLRLRVFREVQPGKHAGGGDGDDGDANDEPLHEAARIAECG